jgi:hypothetical protein
MSQNSIQNKADVESILSFFKSEGNFLWDCVALAENHTGRGQIFV